MAKTKTNSKKKWSRKKKVWFTILMLLCVAIIAGGSFFAYLYTQVPPLDTANFNYIENSKILDKDGNAYQNLMGSEYRETVTYDQIPENLSNAFIAIEDERFRSHSGIDYRRFTSALLNVVTSGSLEGPGGSTITQQLIKLTHLTSEKTINRKFEEIILAFRLEKVYSKDQILEAYLNKVNMSEAWGVEAASKVYFGKDVSDLTLAQSAVLASIVNLPSYYNPYVYTEDENGEFFIATNDDGSITYNPNNQERALLVIDKMKELSLISEADYTQAKTELETSQIGLVHNYPEYSYSYFTDAVYSQVLDDLMARNDLSEDEAIEQLLNGGLTIYSTVDANVQSIMESNAQDDSLYPSQSYAAAVASSEKSADLGEPVNYTPEVGMTVIDNQTGAVAGIVGGRTEKTNLSLNRALQKFQTGSSTKPLTAYGPALDTGAITLATTFENVAINVNGWQPQNAGGGYTGTTTVRTGLTNSINTMAVQALMESGLETSADYGRKLGLDISDADLGPAALALGGYSEGQTPLAMAEAFATFPNMGTYTEPYFYTKVVNSLGETILSNDTPETSQVFKPSTAFLVTDVLEDVVQGGTTTLSIPGQEVAGKTGTTDEERHAWFCGYTNYYTMSVWLGYDTNYVETSQGAYNLNIDCFGGSFPGPAAMFQSVMRDIHADLPSSTLPTAPDDIETATVDKMSGKLATSLTYEDPRGSQAYTEYFASGTTPTKNDDWHVSAEIDSSTGQLATEYCPENLVKTQVFLDLPSDNIFPDGVSPVYSDFWVSSESALRLPTENCTLHTSKTASEKAKKDTDAEEKDTEPETEIEEPDPDSLNFTLNTKANAGSTTLSVGKTATLSVDGPANATTTFSSSNDNITLAANGNTATITAESKGSATITVTQTTESTEYSRIFNVTIN